MCFVFPDADAILKECDPVDFIVSNPPYLLSQDMKTLQTEIFRLGQHADTLNMCFNLWCVFENSSCNLLNGHISFLEGLKTMPHWTGVWTGCL